MSFLLSGKKNCITFSEGRSGTYFTHAFACIAVAFPAVLIWGGVFLEYDQKKKSVDFDQIPSEGWVILAFVLALFYLGFVFIYAGTGVEFNTQNREWRSYSSLLGAKFGQWVSLPDMIQEIQLTKEYELNPNYDSRTKRKTDVNHISYRVVCVYAGNKEVLLYEFTKYKPAYLFAETLGEYCHIAVWDQVEEQREEAYRRRGMGRRK